MSMDLSKLDNRAIEIKFKKLMLDFNDQLMVLYPHDTDLILSRMFIRAVDNSELLTGFKKFVLPAKSLAINRDIKFFDVAKENPIAEKYFGKFQTRWSNLLDENKDKIWQYIQLSVQLAEAHK